MTALPYLAHFETDDPAADVWINPTAVISVILSDVEDSDAIVYVRLGGGVGYIVKPPQGDDFTSDPVEAVCRRLAGLPLCDGSHPEPHLRQVPAFAARPDNRRAYGHPAQDPGATCQQCGMPNVNHA